MVPARQSAGCCVGWSIVNVKGSGCPAPLPSLLSPSPPHPESSTKSAPAANVSKKQLNSNLEGAYETSEKEQQEAIEHVDEAETAR